MSGVKVLALYKSLLRESAKFSSYNYRQYARRRVRDAFRENRSVSDEQTLNRLVEKAEDNLAMMRRQVVIGQMYKEPTLVIETPTPST